MSATTTAPDRRADCPDHPGLATFSLSTGFCTCGRAHSRWITTPATPAPDSNAHVRQLINMTGSRLRAERAEWVRAGSPAGCVRPAGEAFGWRQGSGPCDCPPCLARSAADHTPAADAGPTV